MIFFLRDKVRGVVGKSRSSCNPFEPRETTPFKCLLFPLPFANDPFECTASADRGRDNVDK
jgi:hypothetical protein